MRMLQHSNHVVVVGDSFLHGSYLEQQQDDIYGRPNELTCTNDASCCAELKQRRSKMVQDVASALRERETNPPALGNSVGNSATIQTTWQGSASGLSKTTKIWKGSA